MNLPRLAFFAATLICAVTASGAPTTININPDQDTFVRSSDPTHNYGSAGALSISGSTAVNGSSQQMGTLDSFMRFSFLSVTGSFNSLYGSNNWSITGVTLKLTENATPNQSIFNRGQGSFEIRWIGNDSWVEGAGTPMGGTTDGIVYNDESTVLGSGGSVSLGTFSNTQTNTQQSFVLPVSSSSFANDMTSGTSVSFFMTATTPGIGFTFNSREFVTGSSRPILSITANTVPEPGTVWMLAGGLAALCVFKVRHARRQTAR